MHTEIDAAPISTFPTEILQTIFTFDQDASPYELRPKSQYPQLRLAHVCRTWRLAAFGIPSLWTKIHISLQHSRSAGSANGHLTWSWQEAFDMFLSFAKNYPLTIKIEWCSQDTAVQEVQRISAALFQTSLHWKVAALSFWTEIHWSFLQPLHAKLPLLEDLTLYVSQSAWGAPLAMRTCNAFSVAPSLRSIRLQSHVGGLPRLEIPWHQITRLFTRLPMFGLAEISRFIDIALVSCGELKELSILDPIDGCTSPPSSIVMPSLTRLSFKKGRYLVGGLILPALRELTVWDAIHRGSNKGFLVTDAVRELICRSDCTITVLNIEDYAPLTARPLAKVAVHFHALTRLSVHTFETHGLDESQDAFATILAILTPSRSTFDTGESNIFPLLEHLSLTIKRFSLSLEGYPVSQGSVDALCDMLELRYPSHSASPRLFTRATFFPGAKSLQPTLIADFERSAWARISRVYQGQLDVSIHVLMSHPTRYDADFEMWLGRTAGGGSLRSHGMNDWSGM